MGNEPMDYAIFLADLEAKRSALDAAIASVRAALALGALGQAGDVPPSTGGPMPTFGLPSGGDVPAGAFLGKSIPDATKLYLEIVKKKQTSKEIAEALQKGGMETNSKNFPQMVHSVLDRARKANSGIVKLDRSHWGLATWYPPNLLSSGAYQGRGAGRKKARKGKTATKVNSQPASPSASSAAAPKARAIDRALQYLQSKRAEHSAAEVGTHLGMGEKGARLLLGKLVKAGKARTSAPGMYTVVPFQLAATG